MTATTLDKIKDAKGAPEPESCCSKVIYGIWPVKHKIKAKGKDNNELYLRTTLMNLIVYIFFIFSISVVNFGPLSLLKFYFSDGMVNLFLENQGSSIKAFKEGFQTYDDVWLFLNTTVPNGLYFEKWYDMKDTAPENLGYILYQNKLLGKPRISQSRVSTNSCKVPDMIYRTVKTCYPPFEKKFESTEVFGKGLNESLGSDDITYSAWRYKKDPSGSTTQTGILSSYPTDGFMIDLGSSSESTISILQDLRANKWIDLNTRVVSIDFSVFNGNIQYFTQIKFMMEFPPSGGVLNSWSFRTAKLIRYSSSIDYFVMACEILFCIFIVYFTIEEILDIQHNKTKYFKDIYNLIDLVVWSLSVATIGLSVYRNFIAEKYINDLLMNSYSFENFTVFLDLQEMTDLLSALILFFAWIKIFKYVSLNRTLNQLNLTLKKCAKDVGSFFIIFFIFFFTYAQAGYLMFGETLKDYQTVFRTLFTLFRIILGDFNFVDLRNNFSYLGPIYFISYIFFCFFILVNMFFAIINDSYAKVKEENAQALPEFEFSDYIKLKYSQIVDKLNMKHDRLADIQAVISTTDSKIKNGVDFASWRQDLRKKGYADMEIESIFNSYDKDKDMFLNQKEVLKLKTDIERAKLNLKNELKAFKETHKENSVKDNDGFDLNNTPDSSDLKKMSRDDLEYVVERTDKVELKLASIIGKIDKIFQFLEKKEIEKLKKRQALSQIADKENKNE